MHFIQCLFLLLIRYCAEKNLNVFDFTPSTFLFSLNEKFWEIDLLKFCDFFYKYLPDPLLNKVEYKKNTIDIRGKFRPLNIRNAPKNGKKRTVIPSTAGQSDKLCEMKMYPSFLGEG